MTADNKERIAQALQNISTALNEIQEINDDLESEEEQDAIGKYFGHIKDYGSLVEQYGSELLTHIEVD